MSFPLPMGFGFGLGLPVHLASGGHVFGYGAVCEQHEFLDEPVGFLGEFLVYADGLAVLVNVHLHFRAVEVHGAGGETLFAQLQGQFVEDEHGFLHLGGDHPAFASGSELLLHGPVSGFDDGLGQFIVKTVVGDNVGAAEPGVDDFGLGRQFKDGREGEFFLVGAQGAKLVGEFLRQHGDGAVHQIDGGAAGLGLLVHRGVRPYVPSDIGNMDAHFVVAVFQFAEAQGVVKVFGIGGVYGESEHLPEVPAMGAVLVRNLFRNGIGRIFYAFFEAVGQAELRQDGVHLRLVLPGHAQHVHHMAVGARSASFPAVHHGGHLHAPLPAFRDGDGDVVGHGLGAHEHPGLFAHDVEESHERLLRALHDGDNLSAAALGLAHFLLRYSHPHRVSVQGAPRLGGFHIDVFFLPFDAYEGKSLAGHQYFSLEFGNKTGFLLVILSVGTVLSFRHFCSFYCTKIRKICRSFKRVQKGPFPPPKHIQKTKRVRNRPVLPR